ncbi:MAG: sigma-70 family RNA polymerase sigma factor [Planctomycetes bacterium]|nr:sigma-70 family RNA polymerase sigma factor [Planctomycetota bacterium]
MPRHDLTRLLNDAARGHAGAADRLLPVIYDELRGMARRHAAGESPTVEPTALVHEAWLRLAGDGSGWSHRGHFFGAAARAMRRLLVESARRRRAGKRGGDAIRAPADDLAIVDPDPARTLDLDEALAGLEREHPREARVVELRYFGGLSVEEVAEVLGVSVGTVERDWRLARARLSRRLG